jgi:uncharacterized membrane protein YgcG
VCLLPSFSQSSNASQNAGPNPLEQYRAQGYVNDFAGMLDAKSRTMLEQICKRLDRNQKTQMTVVTVPSLEGMPIKEFATQLANRWGVGYKDTNRGILILLAKDEHQYRISVGRGLESVLPDEKADRLGQEMLPMLRRGAYGTAVLHLANRLADEVSAKGELSAPSQFSDRRLNKEALFAVVPFDGSPNELRSRDKLPFT